jgi:dihydrofolate reductase
MANFIYIAASLDGYIADADGGIEWLEGIPNPDQSDFGFADFLAKIDAIVMGRKTFEKVLTFPKWPYIKPVFVMTNSLFRIPSHLAGKVSFLNREPGNIIKSLAQKGYRNLYIDGGITIQGFLKENLIDEMIITTIPVLLGNGIPLFGSLPERQDFILCKSEIIGASVVKNHYKRTH